MKNKYLRYFFVASMGLLITACGSKTDNQTSLDETNEVDATEALLDVSQKQEDVIIASAEPEKVDPDNLVLNGISGYWQLVDEVYVGVLYLPSLANTTEDVINLSGVKRMEIYITAEEWVGEDFSKVWTEMIHINTPDSIRDSLKKEINAYTSMLKGPLVFGDRLVIKSVNDQLTLVTLNEVEILRLEKENFFNVLLMTWIGARPPATQFKEQILTLDKENIEVADMLYRLDYIQPVHQQKRKSEILAWHD